MRARPCPHVWLVDPEVRTLEGYRLAEGSWRLASRRGGDELVRAEPFADIDLELSIVWERHAPGT